VNALNSRSFRLVALAISYFVAGRLGLLLANVHSSISPIWPATGVAMAGLLLWGNGLWPAIFAAAFLVNVTTLMPENASAALRIAQAAGIASGNTLEAIAGA